MFTLYALSVVSAAAACASTYRAARRFDVPVVVAVCICAGALLYVSSLIPGALAQLSAPAVGATMVVASALVVLLLRRLTSWTADVRLRPATTAVAHTRLDGLLV